MTAYYFPPAYMTKGAAAHYLDMSEREFDGLVTSNEVTAYSKGKRPKFQIEDLDAWRKRQPERVS